MLSAVSRFCLLFAVPIGFLIGMVVVHEKDTRVRDAAGGNTDVVTTGSITR